MVWLYWLYYLMLSPVRQLFILHIAWYTVGDKISQPLQSAEKPSDFEFRLDETLLTPRVGSCGKFSNSVMPNTLALVPMPQYLSHN